MQPGDVILVRRPMAPVWSLVGILDRLIQFATMSPYYHAALVADNGDLIEARFRGVQRAPVDKYQGRADVRTVRGATPAGRAKAVAFAQGRVGMPYGWGNVMQDALRLGLHINWGDRWRHLRHLDCSCLVTAAWADANIWLTYVPAPTPGDLGFSPMLLRDV